MNEKNYPNGYAFHNMAQYDTLISAIPGGIIITAADDNFTILFANQGYYDMVGYLPEEHTRIFQHVGVATLYPEDAPAVIAQAKQQLAQTGNCTVKARLHHKSKGYIWVHLSARRSSGTNTEALIYMVIMDISEHQDTLEQLNKEKKFNDLIASLSDEIFFDCDLLAGSIHYSKGFADTLGFAHLPSEYRAALKLLGLLSHASEDSEVADLFTSMDGGLEQELLFVRASGETMWYLCRCNLLHDRMERPLRLVGKLTDITQHKLQIDALSYLAQQDQLTGLLNKATTEALIKETLKLRRAHDADCALMIIDIDNFKDVNDRLGHLYGDAVLAQLAEYLKPLFRSEDIVGRVGGDEFFVFLKNYSTTETLLQKAQEICDLFHKTYSEGAAFVSIAASIGIALCPENGVSFDELYKKADAALYDAKAMGKNTFAFYNMEVASTYSSTRTEIDANALKKRFKENRIEYVFRLLYDSETPATSIQSVLQLVTESYDFSRGYIFETSSDGRYTSNTFEWCAKAVSTQLKNLQNLPIGPVATAHAAFMEQGRFILKSVSTLPLIEREILEPQGIRAMFQFGIISAGKLAGFIGFDDCFKERTPSDNEIDEICTVCHVLATFLLKHRSTQREGQRHEAIERVMDQLQHHVYVIDPQSHLILYENKWITALTGGCSMGQPCYAAYCKRTAPCPDCPAVQLDPNTSSYVSDLQALPFGLPVRTQALRIDWARDSKAYLLCGATAMEAR